MANNFKQLSSTLHKLALGVVENANKRKRTIASAIVSELINETPIDEGRARSNWQASSGSDIKEKIEPYYPGTKGSTASENTSAALSAADKAIRKSVPEVPLYVVNNLEYIEPLNNGHSPQVNPGFIQDAVEGGIIIGRKVKLLD